SDHSGELSAETFGPFVDRHGRLARFKSFHSGAFLRVSARNILQFPPLLQILIPAASTPDTPDLLNWTLASGSVWIRSPFLVAGVAGFTGLRIKGGTMKLAAGAVRPNGVDILVPFQSV